MKSLQIVNDSFTLSAYYGFLQCLWRFINTFGIFMMFSTNFEHGIVLLLSKATPVFHYRRLVFWKHRNSVHAAEPVVHPWLQ